MEYVWITPLAFIVIAFAMERDVGARAFAALVFLIGFVFCLLLVVLISGCSAEAGCISPDFGTFTLDDSGCRFRHTMEDWISCSMSDGTEWKRYDDGRVVHYEPLPGWHHVEGTVLCEERR